MKYPPLGYDDETIMPSLQVKHFLHQLLQKLSVVDEKISDFSNDILDEIASIFDALLKSAEELPAGHRGLVEEIFKDYRQFIKDPSGSGLQKLKQKIVEFTVFFRD